MCYGLTENMVIICSPCCEIKKADRFLLSICLCIGYLFFGSPNLSAKGKRRFYICVLVQRKIAFWVAKKPDRIGLFAGDIFFVSTLWSARRDSNPRPSESESAAISSFATGGCTCRNSTSYYNLKKRCRQGFLVLKLEKRQNS